MKIGKMEKAEGIESLSRSKKAIREDMEESQLFGGKTLII